MMTVARQYSVTTTVIHRVASLSDGGPRVAPFKFEDESETLKFDGALEDCVQRNLSSGSRDGLFTNINQLEPLCQQGKFDEVRKKLESEEVVKVDLGTDRKWTATMADQDVLELRNGVSKLEVFPGGRSLRMTVRADLAKIEQQIGGSFNPSTGTITVDSEQVQVTQGQV